MNKNFQNRKDVRERKPMTSVTYIKKCTDIEQAFYSLINAHPEIENVLNPEIKDHDDEGQVIDVRFSESNYVKHNEINLWEMTSNVISYVQDFCPDLEKMENMRTVFSLKPNRMFLQTNRFVSFGWMIRYTKADNKRKAYIDNIELMIILYGDKSIEMYEDKLLSDGWDKKEE